MITTIDVDPGSMSAGPIPAQREIVAVRVHGLRRMVDLVYCPKDEFDGSFAGTRSVRSMPTYWCEGTECVELNYAAPCALRIDVEMADYGGV